MAHKKSGGSTNNGRDSNPQYRGIKLYSGETAKAGSIIVRQCGTKFKAGYLVRRGNDDTLRSSRMYSYLQDPDYPLVWYTARSLGSQ